MSELTQRALPDLDGGEEDLSRPEAAAYIADLCEGMASLARRLGLLRTAASLDQVGRSAAADMDES